MTAKIRVVDDERDITDLLAFNLKNEGYQVFTALDGMDALNIARKHLPDLIVLDLMLPELDGIAVCEILHRLPSTASIPVLMLTAESREVGMQAGAVDYMVKPFSVRDVIARIRSLLENLRIPIAAD